MRSAEINANSKPHPHHPYNPAVNALRGMQRTEFGAGWQLNLNQVRDRV
jgi:hypothetical protein